MNDGLSYLVTDEIPGVALPLIRSSSKLNKYFEVPYDSNKNYVERLRISVLLDEKVGPAPAEDTSIAKRRVVLFGLGGSGKTEIALRFAERHRQDYEGVFWVGGADVGHLQRGFLKIAKLVGLGHNQHDSDAILEDTQTWLSSNRRWLLIIDNLDDDTVIDALRERFLKGGMDGHILITSRNPSTAAHWDSIEVSDMEPIEAASLFARITGRCNPDDEQVLGLLLQDLAYLPLAIDQASSYILETGMTSAEYRRHFENERHRLLTHIPSTQYNYGSRQTVMTTWELSFQRVQSQNLQASKLMLIFGLFSPDDIPLQMLTLNSESLSHWAPNGEFEELPPDQRWISDDLAAVLHDVLHIRDALSALRKFSLIRFRTGGNSVSIHPLVHYWASYRLSGNADSQSLSMSAIGIVASSFEREERMPPVMTPFGRRDFASTLEEKSLRLWPWRQYPFLAPHAYQCMRSVRSIHTMTESVAHLSLALLQVYEYYSEVGRTLDPGYSRKTSSSEIMDHVLKCDRSEDEYLKLTVAIWRLFQAVKCACQKYYERSALTTPGGHTKRMNRCPNCEQAFQAAILYLTGSETNAHSTARNRATSMSLYLILQLDHYGKTLLEELKGIDHHNIQLRFGLTGVPARFSHQRDLSMAGTPLINWFSGEAHCGSWMETYVFNTGLYMIVRTFLEQNHRNFIEKTAFDVADTFRTICGPSSEEYRRSAWYLTTTLRDPRRIEDILNPLVESSLANPVESWSHERCIIRLVEVLFAQHKEEEGEQVFSNASKAYQYVFFAYPFRQSGEQPRIQKGLSFFM